MPETATLTASPPPPLQRRGESGYLPKKEANDRKSAITDTRKSIYPLTDSHQYDVVITGAGVAGASLAWYLGKQGIRVAVIERDLSEPEKFIGELLQPGGVMKLQELGYKEVLNGFDAQQIGGYALFMNDDHFEIPYPEINGQRVTGRGFRYGKFISKLRGSLREIPSVTLIEGSVLELLESKSDGAVTGVKYQSKEENKEKSVHAQLTVICDGGFSRFREELNGGEKQVKGFMLGLLLKDCELPCPNHGHVFLGGSSPFLSYPVSSSETRVLIDFPGAQPPKKNRTLHRYLNETVFPLLPESMRQPFLHTLKEERFRAMPNMMIPSKPVRKQGVVLLGDALNMRHPLTGGGMTAALTDVQLLGSLIFKLDSLKSSVPITRAVNEFYNRRHASIATINILADALYGVMSEPDLKDACYEYLKRGSGYAEAPISILSAVSRDRELLVRKFFSVALFGAGRCLHPFPTPKRMRQAFNLFRNAVRILAPLLMNERPSAWQRWMIQSLQWIFPLQRSTKNNQSRAVLKIIPLTPSPPGEGWGEAIKRAIFITALK